MRYCALPNLIKQSSFNKKKGGGGGSPVGCKARCIRTAHHINRGGHLPSCSTFIDQVSPFNQNPARKQMLILIFLQVSCLSLAFHSLGIQAVPAPTAKVTKEVSILDILGDSPEILEAGNFSYQHSLPEPDWDDYYIEDGIKFHRYPEGTVLPAGFWNGRSKIEIPKENVTRYVFSAWSSTRS